MKHIKIIVSAACLGGALLLGTGCKKYLDINKNPNVAQDVLPEQLLPSAQIFLGSSLGVDLQVNGCFWAQYWTQSPASSQYKIYDRYSPTSSTYDRVWGLLYSSGLADLNQLEKKGIAGNQRQYTGIAKLLKAYAFHVITDGWGDVPFSEALKGLPEDGGITAPHYDAQSSVYNGIAKLIQDGRALLASADSNGLTLNGDLVYGGDLVKWQQFANTLELKLYLRLSEKDPARAQAGVTNIVTKANAGVGFIDESSDAQINYSTTAGNQNPLYSEMSGLNKVQNIVASKTVIDSMNSNTDLRVEVFFNAVAGAYVGIAQGNYTISSSTPVSLPNATTGADVTTANGNAKSPLAPVKFISSYESYFLQAEAAARGWGAGNAKSLFESGITASFASYSSAFDALGEILVDSPEVPLNATTAADAYINGNVDAGIDAAYWAQYPSSGTLAQKLRHIITQKWFSMCGNQGFEAWTEWRRTGYPEFFTVSVQSALPKTKAFLPRSFFYPDVEVQRNLNFPRATCDNGQGILGHTLINHNKTIMKKILLSAATLTVLLAACKKDEEDVATQFIVTPSYPTITFGAGQYFSINTGGSLPTVAATAYDSTIKESYPVSIEGTDALDNTTPGLYIISAKATNRYGYYTNSNVYVAVTNIDPSKNLTGNYKRVDVGTGDVAKVKKLANGLYQTDNVAGANRTSRPDLLFPILFVQKNDTTLLFPDQDSPFGTMKFKDANNKAMQASFQSIPGDTSYRYAITAPSSAFGGALRKFKKQ